MRHMTLSGSSHSRPEQKWYAPHCTRVFFDTHSSVITSTLLPLDIHSAVTTSFLCCSCSSKRHRAQLLSPQQTITEPKGRWSSHKYAMPCRLQEMQRKLHVPSSCAVLAVLQHVLGPVHAGHGLATAQHVTNITVFSYSNLGGPELCACIKSA